MWALQGVGLRSNYEAVTQLMEEDLFGARRVAVVRDDFEQNQVTPPPPPLSPHAPGASLISSRKPCRRKAFFPVC